MGIHTGIAYVGTVRGIEGTAADITALGDNVNIAARLVALAQPGEILMSDATYAAAGLDLDGLEQRQVELKGKSRTVRRAGMAAGDRLSGRGHCYLRYPACFPGAVFPIAGITFLN